MPAGAWGHARAIETLAAARPDCPRTLSDQFARPEILQRALREKGLTLQLEQRTKGESDTAVAAAFTGPRDRVLIESPVYPNATQALRSAGARLVGSPVDPDGWDLAAVGTALREVAPTLAYLIPDFQNPTGHLMSDDQRAVYARYLRRSGTDAVVDEAHQALAQWRGLGHLKHIGGAPA